MTYGIYMANAKGEKPHDYFGDFDTFEEAHHFIMEVAMDEHPFAVMFNGVIIEEGNFFIEESSEDWWLNYEWVGDVGVDYAFAYVVSEEEDEDDY